MEIVYSPEAREDLELLPESLRDKIRSKISELEHSPTDHEDAKLIRIGGREVYRLKVRKERGGKLDHRVIYDIEDGEIRVFSILHRDEGYSNGDIQLRELRAELSY